MKPRLAAGGSETLVKMLNTLYSKASPEGIEQQKASLAETIRAEVTAELIKKFNPSAGFKSIGEVHANRTTVDDVGQFMGEDDFRNMDDASTRKALGG